MGIMSIALFRKKEDPAEKVERAVSEAMKEVATSNDTGRKLQPVKQHETITQRHRIAIEHTKRELDMRTNNNNEEMERLTREYNELMGKLESDNKEYALSIKAMNASLDVFDEAEKKVPIAQSLWDRVQAEGKTIELVRQMFEQSIGEHPNDTYAAFADHLGWNREDAKALAFALAFSDGKERQTNVA